MEKEKLNNETVAIKWSLLTEIIVKLISPVTNMVLARLLTPKDFGLIASIVMITTFADMFTDAGFQKFIIQHQFKDKKEQDNYVSVSFFTNLGISLFFFFLIFVFSSKIAKFTGVPGYGNVFRIYALIIILTSFSSIQYAVYRKKLQYKKLGIIRIIVKLVPLIVTVPIAWFSHSFWALVIGNLVGEAITAIALMLWSEQKIHLFYSIHYLKQMFSFCAGSMLETLSSWSVANISIFIISQFLGSYYLGIYKTSITTINQIISIITATVMNIYFATLSTKQADDNGFRNTIIKYQRIMGMISIPLGFGLLVFRDLVTRILLGNQWGEASLLIGLWGFVMCESIIFADLGAYALVAKGRPALVFVSNIIQTLLLGIVLYGLRDKAFIVIIIGSFIVRWQLTFTHYGLAKKVSKLRFSDLPRELLVYFFASIIMSILGMILLRIESARIIMVLIWGLVCLFVYFAILIAIPQTRLVLGQLFSGVIGKTAKDKL